MYVFNIEKLIDKYKGYKILYQTIEGILESYFQPYQLLVYLKKINL